MPKFKPGQAVSIAFNPAKVDENVPDQKNGKFPGTGNYQTEPNQGYVIEVREKANVKEPVYLVDVKLVSVSGEGVLRREVVSWRKREIVESKLTAV